MRDLLGNEVKVGDRVVISRTGSRKLMTAEVSKITPKGIKAKYPGSRPPPNSGYTEDQQYDETFCAKDTFMKAPRQEI